MSSRPVRRRASHRGRPQLIVMPGDEYLGSIEPECLQVLSYCKLSRVPVEIKTACLPWKSPSWRYPTMITGGREKKVSDSVGAIIAAVKDLGFNIDRSLEAPALAETMAYSDMLTQHLQPAIMYSRWMDTQNYMEVTSGQYASMMKFPLSTLYLSWRYRATQRALMRGASPDTTLEQLGIELLAKAEEVINFLSTRLGEGPFFNGESPTSLDAMVYGYLEVILQSPLPGTNSLHQHLHSCTNLLHFCSRVRAKAFPDTKQRVVSPVPAVQPMPLWRDPKVWLAVGVASVLLGVQAARVGLLARLAARLAATTRHRTLASTL